MARKAVGDKKRDDILSAAKTLFFEKGYDGTSVRGIMKLAGAEVGLFYYYFDNKDDAFNKVLENFFEGYKQEFSAIASEVYRDPFRTLTKFFKRMISETGAFREKYAENIHCTVRWAIRERTLTMIVPYIKKIIEAISILGAKPPLSSDVTSVILAHGVGSMILHEDSDWMLNNFGTAKKAVNLLMGLDYENADLMFPESPVSPKDAEGILELLEENKDCFYDFERDDFEQKIMDNIGSEEALVVRNNGKIVGCVIFSRESKTIDQIAVSEKFRGCGIAKRLLVTALSEFQPEEQVSIRIVPGSPSDNETVINLLNVFDFREQDGQNPYRLFTASVPEVLQPFRNIIKQ